MIPDRWKVVLFAMLSIAGTIITHCEAYYQTYYLEDARVCPPFGKKKKIKLSSKSATALIIKLTKYPIVSEQFTGCHLEIEAPKGYGLQAVIEDINFRVHPMTDTCLDYIMFGRDDDGALSKEICGQRHLVPKQSVPSQIYSHTGVVDSLTTEGHQATTFFDSGGELHIWVQKSMERFEAGMTPLDLKVVVTAYKHACKMNDTQMWSCSTSPNKNPKVQDSCIDSSLVCDGHINCGVGAFSDEANCKREHRSTSTVTMGILVAVGLLLICLLGSIYCFCRRRAARRQRDSEADRYEEQCLRTRELTVQPPPLILVSMPHNHCEETVSVHDSPRKKDCDLPPSYEELFPQAGPASSGKPN